MFKKKKIEKKTYITINSKDRIKRNKIISELNYIKVEDNGLIIDNYNNLIVKHKNHGFNVDEKVEIIFKNIVGNYDDNINKYTVGGIPVEYLNYNEEKGKPIFVIDYIYDYDDKGNVKIDSFTNKRISNSYKIKINFDIDQNLIRIGESGGGNKIEVERIKNFMMGYEDSSYYKIPLPRIFKNIKRIKLVSLEMENAQYNIRNLVKKENNNNSDYMLNNNYIYWINKNDLTKLNNKFLVNNEKVNLLLNNKSNNIPNNWKNKKKKEILLYEHLSDVYLNKISTNLNILKSDFMEYLYQLKNILINPIVNGVLSEDDKIKINNGYFVKFTYNLDEIVLYLKDRVSSDINKNNYYIDDFNDIQNLINFVYKYTNFNTLTNTYDNNLNLRITSNESDIQGDIVNIYGYLKNLSLTKDLKYYLLNNTIIKFDYQYFKKQFINHIRLLINEINEYEYNNNDLNQKLIKLQYRLLNFLENLRQILVVGLLDNEKDLVLNGYIVSFINNNKTYRLFIKNKDSDYVVLNNVEDYFLEDIVDFNKFINFVKLYSNYDLGNNNYNISINFLSSDNYTNTTNPIDIYGYLRNLSINRTLLFNFNGNSVDYNFIKTEYLDIIKKTIEECIISNNNSYSLLVNKPNLNDTNYWVIPNDLRTNIYNISQINGKSDYMVETPQNYNDLMNLRYLMLDNLIKYNLYPIYSVQVNEGNYTIDTLLENMVDKLNNISRKKYDYFSKTFIEDKLYNNKIAFNSEVNKHNFVIDLDETTNLVKMFQYNIIYSYSSLDLTEVNQSGPFVVNEGYPFLFVKHKNHKLHTGNIIKIEGGANIFNITSENINKHHYILTHKIYRMYVRQMLPLESGTIEDVVDNNYYIEGNSFIEYSSFESGINKIFRSNEEKKHIGTNTKILSSDYDISKYELMIGKTNLDVLDKNVIGRVINFSLDDTTKNYIIDYALLSDINFHTGMIFKTSETNTFYMIVPSNWSNDYLPKNKDIINNDIVEIKNITEGYSIKTSLAPNKTSLKGIGGININIKEPVEFSLLFNKNDSIHDVIGFENKESGFDITHSNTYKTNSCIIDYSYLEPTFNDSNYNTKRYVMIKTIKSHNYNVGDIIYISKHLLNNDLIYKNNCSSLNINQYEPFCSYYNNLPLQYQKIIKNSLTSDKLNEYKNKGLVVYYNVPYNKRQLEDLGNLGMSIRKYNKIDYFNYKEVPYPTIANINSGSYIYINQNQKTIKKIKDNVKTTYKTGLRDGYYKVLGNIPCFNNSYYSNYFNNSNTAIIEVPYTILSDFDALRKLNYSEVTQTNNTKYTENILEGYLNGGEIITSNIDTNIVGDDKNSYNVYKSKLVNIVDNKNLELFYPINKTNYININFINNIYLLNNSEINELIIYRNIKYIFDISNNNLLNKTFIVSNIKNTEVQYNYNNNVKINGISGLLNSFIELEIDIYENVNELYIIDNNSKQIVKLIIKDIEEIKYKVVENKNDFIFENTNTIGRNISFEIDFCKKYIFEFTSENTYNNFIICNYNNFNNKVDSNFIEYDNINFIIKILINSNDYDKQLYYHCKNINNLLGKFKLGIYNYYDNYKSILINSKYIDNIYEKILNNSSKKEIDLNIINYVSRLDNYKILINLKHELLNKTINNDIIPHYNYDFLYENTKKNQKFIKFKKIYEVLNIISSSTDNTLTLSQPNQNLQINDKIIFQNSISNTSILKDSTYYIIFIDNTKTKIKLGEITNKLLVKILINQNFDLNSVLVRFYQNQDYIKSELINKSIKINYLQSYNKLVEKTYNQNISVINNDINNINISNNVYYNFKSTNLSIINSNNFNNLRWTTPYGTIRFSLNENTIINYINLGYLSNNDSNDYVNKVHLYYIENDKINFIGSINDIKLSNIINNSYSKKHYLLYFESLGLKNNVYSELLIENLVIGYNNNINNIVDNLNSKIINIKVDNIVNKYIVPTAHLDDNMINETYSLLLNNSKSSIIDINLDSERSLKYYKIIQPISNHSITINNQAYNNYYEYGKITRVELYGSNNIDFSNETEIEEARYNDITSNVISQIEITFINKYSFKYYRFKILNNFDYYPYSTTNLLNTNDILQYKFNTSISGIIVGDIKEIDYSNLYIEDINYINDVKSETDEYIELELKYNLLNSHLKGENIVISDTKVSNNNFSTQNLIIYGNWYTRIFYKGYDTIYNFYKNSRTFNNKYINYNEITTLFQIYGNSKYTIKHDKYIDMYVLNSETNTKSSITNSDINIKKYNITRRIYKSDTFYYTEFIIGIPYFSNNNTDTNIYTFIITDNINDSNTYKNLLIKDSYMKEGIPILQDYLVSNISITDMNGYSIPEYSYNYNNETLTRMTSNVFVEPFKNNNYETFTYNNLDLVYKSDHKICNNINNNLYKNGLPIYGYYDNNTWNDNIMNTKSEFYTNYYCITLKGKYLGHTGLINNKLDNENNIINKNIDGYEILDINYDRNSKKNIIKINLQLNSMGINIPRNYLGDLENIKNPTLKNNYIIGYGGDIFQKKVFKNITSIDNQKYIYLSIKNLNNILGTNRTQYFSKILLSTSPGTHLYDTFINSEIIYETDYLDELSEFEIKFIDDEGKLYNFEGSEHSFMLEIVEETYSLIDDTIIDQ